MQRKVLAVATHAALFRRSLPPFLGKQITYGVITCARCNACMVYDSPNPKKPHARRPKACVCGAPTPSLFPFRGD
jgi:hypothetical protein